MISISISPPPPPPPPQPNQEGQEGGDPLEFLRQLFDADGYYSHDRGFRIVEDTTIVGAMGPPGGGRQEISQRLEGKFNLVCFPEQDDATLRRIFGVILEASMDDGKALGAMVSATLGIYNFACKNLRPTPNKCHYVFNLRDFSRVVQGLRR